MIDIVNSIKHYQPVFWDVDNSKLLESNRSNILYANEQNEKAQQASTDLMAAINQLDINEDYRYVKDELFNKLDGVINSTLQNYGGNLRYAINDIQSMSRDILSSPEITGLVETNQQYKKWKAEIEGRKDISDDIKQMTIEKNPYNFTLQYETGRSGNKIVDDNGNPIVIGYNDWKAKTYPVEQMDYNAMNRLALSYINSEGYSTENIIYYKKGENGKMIPTTDPSEAKYYSVNGYSQDEITSDLVFDSLVVAYNSNAKFQASLKQDYELAKWKASKGEDVYGFYKRDENGNITTEEKTFEEFAAEKFYNLGEIYGYKKTGSSKKLQAMPGKNKDDLTDLFKIRETIANEQGIMEYTTNPQDATIVAGRRIERIQFISNDLDNIGG